MNVFFTELLRKTAAVFFLSENLIIDVGKRLFFIPFKTKLFINNLGM